MIRLSPADRITVGIVGLTLSLLLAADFLGLIADDRRAVVEQRQRFVEMSALQLSVAMERNSNTALKSILLSLVERNGDVSGISVRRRDGVLLASYGEVASDAQASAGNSETFMSLPLAEGDRHAGVVQVYFRPVHNSGPLGLPLGGIWGLVGFIVVVGGGLYWLFLRRSLLYLDPSAVVPERVRKALDVMNNGVLILDASERIVLANDAFARTLGLSSESLVGRKPSQFAWIAPEGREGGDNFPWLDTLTGSLEIKGVALGLKSPQGDIREFLVNSSPILDQDGKQRGVIVGLDDVTDLQHKNKELQFLATRDPMTACHNRRSLYEIITPGFTTAVNGGESLSCIMTDIDHFKSVNDNHGHATGDEIIKMVASVLQEEVGDSGIVSRYGGEEFCIMLFGKHRLEAQLLSERCRERIASKITCGVKVTVSLGVSGLESGPNTVDELILQADQALYRSKSSGRNCVTLWSSAQTQGGGEKVRAREAADC